MYDGRNRLGTEVSAQLMQHFGDLVFRTVVPRNVRLAEAPSHGVSIMHYDKTSRGALAYLALAGEIVRKRSRADKSPSGSASLFQGKTSANGTAGQQINARTENNAASTEMPQQLNSNTALTSDTESADG